MDFSARRKVTKSINLLFEQIVFHFTSSPCRPESEEVLFILRKWQEVEFIGFIWASSIYTSSPSTPQRSTLIPKHVKFTSSVPAHRNKSSSGGDKSGKRKCANSREVLWNFEISSDGWWSLKRECRGWSFDSYWNIKVFPLHCELWSCINWNFTNFSANDSWLRNDS